MATTTVPGKWGRFISLRWYDSVLDFLFRLTARSSEVLLAVGVILSTANHFQHGMLFDNNSTLFHVWTWTQAIGFEASAGVVLSMALDAHEENDPTKRNILLALMVGLAAVGTVMLVMAFVEAATGIQESSLPAWYGVLMAIIRGVVSVAYVTIGRVKTRRFSGAPVVKVAEVPDLAARLNQVSELVQGVQSGVQGQVHDLVQRTLPLVVQQVIQAEMRELVTVMQLEVQDAARVQVRQLAQQFAAQIEGVMLDRMQPLLQGAIVSDDTALRALAEQMQEMTVTVREMRTTFTEVRRVASHEGGAEMKRSPRSGRTNGGEPIRLVQSIANAVESESTSEPVDEPVGIRIKRFISEQRDLKREPALTEIENECRCSRNTAIRYRRELDEPTSELDEPTSELA